MLWGPPTQEKNNRLFVRLFGTTSEHNNAGRTSNPDKQPLMHLDRFGDYRPCMRHRVGLKTQRETRLCPLFGTTSDNNDGPDLQSTVEPAYRLRCLGDSQQYRGASGSNPENHRLLSIFWTPRGI